MPAFSIPLSGLTASSTALATISNNLANLNTVGYKESRATFRDLFYENVGTSGAGTPMQLGTGAAVGSIATEFTSGTVDTTGVPTDVAIMGDGFFVVEKDGVRQYTRAGNFVVGSDGLLRTQDGQTVMGYPAVNGKTNASTLASLQVGKGQVCPASATKTMQARMNLDATTDVGDTFSSEVTIYDALGDSHLVTLNFAKTAQNAWSYQVTLPASATGGTGAATVLTSGTLTFDGAGKLTAPVANVTGIAITGLANGASNMTFDWNLYDDNGASLITQMASASTTAATAQDGYSSGTLMDISIGADGTISGAFSNEKTLALGQIALAQFANEQSLTRVGNNNFAATMASGDGVIGAPGAGGRGTVEGGSLELSNVDIAKEFSDMLIAQRGYQANARAITTFDEIVQETLNLKR